MDSWGIYTVCRGEVQILRPFEVSFCYYLKVVLYILGGQNLISLENFEEVGHTQGNSFGGGSVQTDVVDNKKPN